MSTSRQNRGSSSQGAAKRRKKSSDGNARDRALEALEEGTYYTTIDQLWPVGPSVVKKTYFDELRRPSQSNQIPCLHFSPGQQYSVNLPYEATENALEEEGVVYDAGRGRTSHGTAVKTGIWPVNLFGKIKSGEVAHLLPAAYEEGKTWWFLPELLFGGVEEWTWDARMRSIFGVKPDGPGNPSRTSLTGIVHFATNKARIPGQGHNMDENPCLLVVPIMEVLQMRVWNGAAYDAIVIVDGWDGRDVAVVAEETAMTKLGPVAEPDEVELARKLLLHMVCAISHARQNEPCDIPDDDDDDDNNNAGLDRSRVAAPPGRTVQTPLRTNLANVRVRKVHFHGHAVAAWNKSTHPAPDPLILAAKAAVVWSTRHGFRLAAGAEPQDDDDNWSELDYLAAEQYLEAHDAAARPQSWEQLAIGLGQQAAH